MAAACQTRATMVLDVLNTHLPSPEIPLLHHDAFSLLIAVMLSARCTDARVNEITPALFALAATPEAMAATPWQKIRSIIAPCGLADTKAQRIVETSRLIIERHGGQIPNTFEELEALPGVGHKTASVVMAQAFNHPAFPVDTHIFRLARRWKLSQGKNVAAVEKDLKKLFPETSWNKLHLQIVLWGRKFCPARGCSPACPICSKLEQL